MKRPTDTPRNKNGLDWNDLAIILAICRAQSLSGAARALGKTHSTIFRNINTIEDKTGVRFFDRFDHGYVMTDAGLTAMQHAERVESEIHALELDVLGKDERLSGRLRVTCPEAFAADHAPGIVARFVAENPDIAVDISPGHGAVDLNKREAEIAIRATRSPPEGAYGRKICAFRFAAYATERYMQDHADTPLDQHRLCLIEGTAAWLVPNAFPGREVAENAAVFQCRASRAVQNAAVEGLGLALLPCYVGDADPRLLRVTDPFEWLDLDLWVLTHPDLRGAARVRAMMQFLYDDLGARADLWGGLRKSTSRWNLLLREGWGG